MTAALPADAASAVLMFTVSTFATVTAPPTKTPEAPDLLKVRFKTSVAPTRALLTPTASVAAPAALALIRTVPPEPAPV